MATSTAANTTQGDKEGHCALQEKMQNRLSRIKRKILVMSGKGELARVQPQSTLPWP